MNQVPEGLMRYSVRFLIIGLLIFCAATAAFGQLTQKDITALREQGKKEGWTFEVAENSATEYSLDQLCGLKIPENLQSKTSGNPILPKAPLGNSFDWRNSYTDVPIRNQGGCGSCWAFSTVGALEWAINIHDTVIVDLSEQWLVSCNQDGWSCSGGFFAHDYHQWKTDQCGNTGAVMETNFPYGAWNAPCSCPYPHQYFLDSWAYIGSQPVPTVQEIKQAIMAYGPVSVTVAVNGAFQAYRGGIFNASYTGSLNHAVVIVGWDDNQGTNGVWLMRNSWGPGWGEGGYMRIAYGCSRIGEYANYVVYGGPKPPALSFDYPGGTPDTVPPDRPTSFEIVVKGVYNGVPAPGSGQIHYAVNSGTLQTAPMVETSPAHYTATLPSVSCNDTLAYYVSAEEATGGRFYDPDPASPHTPVVISDKTVVLADDFNTNKGWTVSGDATGGIWMRGIPLGHGDRGDPQQDFDGSALCYVTDGHDGDNDVEGGTTRLDSPTFDLSAGDGRIQYARWYSNDAGSNPHQDVFVVYISNDDGANWTTVETVGPTDQASGAWYQHTFWAGEFVTPTSQMKMRFEASDLGGSEIVEAAVDAFSVQVFGCTPCPCTGYCDLNIDGTINPLDVVLITNYVYKQLDLRRQLAGCPGNNGDWDCSGSANPVDVVSYVNFVYRSSAAGPCDPCAPR